MIDDKLYDILRWLAQLVFPGLATLYFALSSIWGLPYPNEIVGTITAINVFIGALIGLNSAVYNVKKSSMAGDFAFDNVPNPTRALPIDEKTYLILKWTIITVLPAMGSLYSTLSLLWCFPYGEQVVGTVAAITAFGGLLLGISTQQFKKG